MIADRADEGHRSKHRDTSKGRFQVRTKLSCCHLETGWHEAVIDLRIVKENSRKDYRLLKKKAIEWIVSDEDGFPYWCKLADADHSAIRQRLQERLNQQYNCQ